LQVSTRASLELLLDDIEIIDADNHVVEPYDLWTSRVSTEKWGDLVPHVVWDEERQKDVWVSGDQFLHPAATDAWSGYDMAPGDARYTPKRLSDLNPENWRAEDRLDLMSQTAQRILQTPSLQRLLLRGWGGS
jgi:hypothetical protein